MTTEAWIVVVCNTIAFITSGLRDRDAFMMGMYSCFECDKPKWIDARFRVGIWRLLDMHAVMFPVVFYLLPLILG